MSDWNLENLFFDGQDKVKSKLEKERRYDNDLFKKDDWSVLGNVPDTDSLHLTQVFNGRRSDTQPSVGRGGNIGLTQAFTAHSKPQGSHDGGSHDGGSQDPILSLTQDFVNSRKRVKSADAPINLSQLFSDRRSAFRPPLKQATSTHTGTHAEHVQKSRPQPFVTSGKRQKVGVVAPSKVVSPGNQATWMERRVVSRAALPQQTPARRSGENRTENYNTPHSLLLPGASGAGDSGMLHLKSTNEVPEKYRGVFPFPYFNAVQSQVFDDVREVMSDSGGFSHGKVMEFYIF